MAQETLSVRDLDLVAVRSKEDLKQQADILSKIANVKMDEYMASAPESLKKLQDMGVPREALFGLGGTTLFFVAMFVLLNYGAQLLNVFVSVLQPLYFTYKALETETQDDDTVLLTYWMVYGVLHLAEHTILYPIVTLLPGLYFVAKTLFQFWMVNFEGSTIIYERLLAPIFRKHEKAADDMLQEAKKDALGIVGIKIPPSKAASVASEKKEEEATPPPAAVTPVVGAITDDDL